MLPTLAAGGVAYAHLARQAGALPAAQTDLQQKGCSGGWGQRPHAVPRGDERPAGGHAAPGLPPGCGADSVGAEVDWKQDLNLCRLCSVVCCVSKPNDLFLLLQLVKSCVLLAIAWVCMSSVISKVIFTFPMCVCH